MVVSNLLGIVFLHHLLVLFKDKGELSLDDASAAVLQHLLHRLQRPGGVLAVFTYLL